MSLKGGDAEINSILLISNELMSPKIQHELRLPLEFISFAFIEAKMYKHYGNNGVFTLPNRSKWGNRVVYGGLFHLNDFSFYISILDAYHQCSKSALRTNHKMDIHHRIRTKATPISFSTIDELERLKYREREAIDVQTYIGNLNHPKINQRLNKTVSYRINDGVDKSNFMNLYREVIT